VRGCSLLYTQPPESSESPELPLKALSECFEVPLAEFRILWVFMRVGQRQKVHPPFEVPKRASVDTRQTPQEIPPACPRETPHPVSNTSPTMLTRTEAVTCLGILEGEFGYRPSYGRGYIGNPLM
jgi:hypothetical protein